MADGSNPFPEWPSDNNRAPWVDPTPDQIAGIERAFGTRWDLLEGYKLQLARTAVWVDRMGAEERFAAAVMSEAVRDGTADHALFDQMATSNPAWAEWMRALHEWLLTAHPLQREGAATVLNIIIGGLRASD
jgi:hypothetical protein